MDPRSNNGFPENSFNTTSYQQVDRNRVAPPPIQGKEPRQQLPKFGHVMRRISNVIPNQPQPQYQMPQYGNPFYHSFTSMCNPFSYHIQYGPPNPHTQPHMPTHTYPTPLQGTPVPNPEIYHAPPSNQKPPNRRMRAGQGRKTAPRRRKICEKFLRLPYAPKDKLNICLNSKQHIELRDRVHNVRYKYIKYRNITAATGELVFKEHCCSERKKQKCNARIIERLKDGFCCLQGKHICGGTKDFTEFPNQQRDLDEESEDGSTTRELDMETNSPIGFLLENPVPPPPPTLVIGGPVPPPLPSQMSVPNSAVTVTGVLPYSSSPRNTIHVFVKCNPIVLNTSMLRIYFDSTLVMNTQERIMIPCLIPTKQSVWKSDFQSDYCIYCVVPEIPRIQEPTMIDIQVCIRLKNNQIVIGRAEKVLEYCPTVRSKKRKMF